MKLIITIKELKKGDTVIVKDDVRFEAQGFTKITGHVYSINHELPQFTIQCLETNTIESVSIDSGKIFLIG